MDMAQARTATDSGLAIIAGSGVVPLTIAEAAAARGQPVYIFGIQGAADKAIETYPHSWVNFGHVGHVLKRAKQRGCRQMVIVGGVKRPRFKDLRLDFGALRLLPWLLGWRRGGDDSVLSGIVGFFESRGFNVMGAHEIAPDLLATRGVLGKRRPRKGDRVDIEIGFRVVRALGALDVGQAAVVAHRYVLAVEAAEGTDRMLRRCKDIQQWGAQSKRRGVLVKGAKPNQERRVDMPTVGPDTVRHAAEAGLAGIALAADEVMIIDRERCIADADAAGLFIIGVDAGSEADA